MDRYILLNRRAAVSPPSANIQITWETSGKSWKMGQLRALFGVPWLRRERLKAPNSGSMRYRDAKRKEASPWQTTFAGRRGEGFWGADECVETLRQPLLVHTRAPRHGRQLIYDLIPSLSQVGDVPQVVKQDTLSGSWAGLPFDADSEAHRFIRLQVEQPDAGPLAWDQQLPDEESGDLAFWAASGWRSDPVAERRRVPADERSGPGLVMRTQQLLQVEDIQASDLDLWTSDWLRAEGFRGHTLVPLIAEGLAIGAMVIDTYQPRLMDEDEVRFMRLMV
ncbi:MAG: hypothetical protein GTO63_24105, partial [Anaerolineae bacterium]|nr:hypothetical protein [Anaerolineae bacterium]NIN97806.1 hypothetical protein [Anaerolineae bacterium]NIQ80803.1 hypothetical protein [Anaerolineae bacterium]